MTNPAQLLRDSADAVARLGACLDDFEALTDDVEDDDNGDVDGGCDISSGLGTVRAFFAFFGFFFNKSDILATGCCLQKKTRAHRFSKRMKLKITTLDRLLSLSISK